MQASTEPTTMSIEALKTIEKMQDGVQVVCRWPGNVFPDALFGSSDLKALASAYIRLKEAADDVLETWGESWDCSRDPGHREMGIPFDRLNEALKH